MLLLQVTEGMCNRLRAIHAAITFCRTCNQRLHVFWKTSDAMSSSFRDLFCPPECFEVHDYCKETLLWKCLFGRRTIFKYIPQDPKNNFVTTQESIRDSYRFLPAVMTCSVEFYRPKQIDYTWLTPTSEICDEIQSVLVNLGKEPIGIHIRRTDNDMSIKYSPTECFEAVIRKSIQYNPLQKFYLASDDEPTKLYLMALFPNNIFCRLNLPNRSEKNGVREAVVDLFCLSKCKMLYGSYWSSFTNVAADIGGCKVVRLTKDNLQSVLQDIS